MLVFLWQAVIGYAEQRLNGDFDADLLAGFASGAFFECLQKIQFASHDAPTTGFWRAIAQGEQHAVQFVDQQDADTDARNARLEHGNSLVGGMSLRFTQYGKEFFCKRKYAEEKSGVEGITGEGVTE